MKNFADTVIQKKKTLDKLCSKAQDKVKIVVNNLKDSDYWNALEVIDEVVYVFGKIERTVLGYKYNVHLLLPPRTFS